MSPAAVQRSRAPLVAVPACRRVIAPHPYHCVGEKYLAALASAAGVMPLVVPALGGGLPLAALLGRVDGVLLTGSPSNVEPSHYGGPPGRAGIELDPHRDRTTLPLLRAAVAAGTPVLGLCRGLQEINVALGGTLHQHVHEQPGMLDHREDPDADLEIRYGPAHPLDLEPGGRLARLAGATRVEVNSLHAQGVDRLAPGLVVEARAPDGLVEAFRLACDDQYLLAVQWHPEWRVLDDPFSSAIFESFGDACRAFACASRDERHHDLV